MGLFNWITKKITTPKNEDVIELFDFNKIYKNNKIISELRKLTLFSRSGMNHELNNLSELADERKVNVKIIAVKRNNKIIGWAILSKEDSDFGFGKGPFVAKRDGALFEVFVAPAFRRMGVGTALLKKARKHAGSAHLCVAPHDHKSDNFYAKHKQYKQKRLSFY
jgi:ribosomal protein S18 acetylase RimI-like enzyme